jgi:hypothetical protein
MNTCAWPLGNGQSLEFEVHDPAVTEWNSVSGIYIFAYDDGQFWRSIYVGQAKDFSSRIPNHEQWDLARRHGATHVHAKVVPLSANRDTWERLLIEHLQPTLNVQYRGLRRSGS